MAPVAVIDLGSNTLKILVAEGLPLRVLAEATEEVRLSPRNDEPPGEISPRAIREGVHAVERLAALAERHGAQRVRLVATSMVRDARNAAAFVQALQEKTGYRLEILDGTAEARGIAAGVVTDPVLTKTSKLRIVDLGGGSLEYIFRDNTGVRIAASHPLGAVRLTRRFIEDPAAPVPSGTLAKLAAHVQAELQELIKPMAPAVPFVGCGGAFSVSRAILAAERGVGFAESDPVLAVAKLEKLRDQIAVLPLEERIKIPALPESRADILPAALTTLLAVAALGGVTQFVHSRRNLRYGLAGEMLAEQQA